MMAAQAVGTFIGQEAGGEINKWLPLLRAPKPQQNFAESDEKSHVAAHRQKVVNQNFEDKLQTKKLSAENKIPGMDEKINVNKIDELIQQQRDSRMSRWSGSAGITNSDSVNDIQQTPTLLDRISNSKIVNGINNIGDKFTGSILHPVDTYYSLKERAWNLVYYGRAETNAGMEAYGAKLSNAYHTNIKEFYNMLRYDSPVKDTLNIFKAPEAWGAHFVKNDLTTLFGSTYNVDSTLYHSVTKAEYGQSVLNRIDIDFTKSNTRFGKAFYTSEKPEITIAELKYHNSDPTHSISFGLNKKVPDVLDLTNPNVAKAWNYSGGDSYELSQKIAFLARESGFSAIKFPSERAVGNNIAFFKDFNNLLPQMVVPYSEPALELEFELR